MGPSQDIGKAMSENLSMNFGLGKIRHNELNLVQQVADLDLSDDLLQVEYEASELIVDVGWHKPADSEGEYLLLLVRSCDWDNPVDEKRVSSLEDLRRELQAFLTRANELELAARRNVPGLDD